MSFNLHELIPSFYYDANGNLSKEMEELNNSAEFLLDGIMVDELNSIRANQYVATLNEKGIIANEDALGIVPDSSSETIDFRRERLINRINAQPPYSMIYLRNRLDAIIGKNNYNIFIDYANYTLIVEASASNQAWSNELQITINRIKPANIIFKNKPLIVDSVKISEEISGRRWNYNYRAGTTARVSRSIVMASEQSIGILKGGEIMSVKPTLTHVLADEILSRVQTVLINDEYTIDDFVTKIRDLNMAIIEYVVPASAGLVNITNIKLLDADDDILTESNIFVGNTVDVTIKHVIPTSEGV